MSNGKKSCLAWATELLETKQKGHSVTLSTFAKSIHSEHTLNKQVYSEGNVLVFQYAENELASYLPAPTPAWILKFLCC